MNRYSKLLLIIIAAMCVASTTQAQIFGLNFEKQKNTISAYKNVQQTLYKDKEDLLNAAKQLKEKLLNPKPIVIQKAVTIKKPIVIQKPIVEPGIIKLKTLFNKGLSFINDKIVTLPSKIYTKPINPTIPPAIETMTVNVPEIIISKPLPINAPKIISLNKIMDAYTKENKKHTFNIGLTEEISSGMQDIKNHVTGACENTLKNLETNVSNIHYSAPQRYCVSKAIETQKNLFERLKNYFLKNKPNVLTPCQEKQTIETFGFNKKSNTRSIILPQKCRQQMYDYANKKESGLLSVDPKNLATMQENLAFTDKTAELAKKINNHVDGSCKHILTNNNKNLQDHEAQSCFSTFIDNQKNLFGHLKGYLLNKTPKDVSACQQGTKSDSPTCLRQIYDSVKKVWTNAPLKDPKELEIMTKKLALAQKIGSVTQTYKNTIGKNTIDKCVITLNTAPKNTTLSQDLNTQSCMSKIVKAQKTFFESLKNYLLRNTDTNTLSECQTTPDRSFLNTVKNYISNSDQQQECYQQIHDYIEKEKIGPLSINPKDFDLGNTSLDLKKYIETYNTYTNYAIAGGVVLGAAATAIYASWIAWKIARTCCGHKKPVPKVVTMKKPVANPKKNKNKK